MNICFSWFWKLEVQSAGAPAQTPGEGSLLMAALSYPTRQKKEGLWSLSFVIWAEISLWGLHTHDLIPSHRLHLPIPSQWGSGLQHTDLGDTHIQALPVTLGFSFVTGKLRAVFLNPMEVKVNNKQEVLCTGTLSKKIGTLQSRSHKPRALCTAA